MADLNQTPRASRLHIAFFGKTNAGKSSAINQIAGGDVALVSEVAGTTADPVYKSMELLPLGPVVFIDTAGLDDGTELAGARIGKTREVMDKTDIAVIVIRMGDADTTLEENYIRQFQKRNTPCVVVYNDFGDGTADTGGRLKADAVINAGAGKGIERMKQAIVASAPDAEQISLTGDMVRGGVVVLVMPQDMQAPKGRLILPQVQVTRDLLDHGCKVVSVKTEDLRHMLGELRHPPALVITDSRVFAQVNRVTPPDVPLTSFSILMARAKGNMEDFAAGARAIARLRPGDRVLIAESCAHHALKGDIAREKLPDWLNKYAGGKLRYTNWAGHGFPDDLSPYKLVIHCGACMVNRKNMLSKIEKTRDAAVPITNFGVAIAFLNDMLDRVGRSSCW